MNNKNTFQLWDKSIILCNNFVKLTNITKYTINNDLTVFISFIIEDIVKVFEKNCMQKLSHSEQPTLNLSSSTINNHRVYKHIYDMIMFFSHCFEEEHDVKLLASTFNYSISYHYLSGVEWLICLFFFLSLKEKLLIDERIFIIPRCIGYNDANSFTNFKEINDYIFVDFNRMFESLITYP